MPLASRGLRGWGNNNSAQGRITPFGQLQIRLAVTAHLVLSQSCSAGLSRWGEMKRFIIPISIVIVILVGLAFLTEGSAIAPVLYRNF
jgi:Family of unknown function (DUF5989)